MPRKDENFDKFTEPVTVSLSHLIIHHSHPCFCSMRSVPPLFVMFEYQIYGPTLFAISNWLFFASVYPNIELFTPISSGLHSLERLIAASEYLYRKYRVGK